MKRRREIEAIIIKNEKNKKMKMRKKEEKKRKKIGTNLTIHRGKFENGNNNRKIYMNKSDTTALKRHDDMMMMPSTVVKSPSYCIQWHSKRNN